MSPALDVQFDRKRKIAIATLNRPEALNAITQSMLDGFVELWRTAREDDRINAIVVRGSLDSKAFTSGVDVRGGEDGSDAITRHPNVFVNKGVMEQIGPRMHYLYKPVICAIHGIRAGAGLFLVNESDIVLCTEDAQFFDPHLSIGITSAFGPIGMSRRVNLGEVLRYTLLSNAERLSGSTAVRIGLATEVVAKDQLWDRADELAAIVATYDTVAVQGTLKAIWESLELGRKAALDRGSLYSDAARASSANALDETAARIRRPYEQR